MTRRISSSTSNFSTFDAHNLNYSPLLRSLGIWRCKGITSGSYNRNSRLSLESESLVICVNILLEIFLTRSTNENSTKILEEVYELDDSNINGEDLYKS